jgi:hypothetical protein
MAHKVKPDRLCSNCPIHGMLVVGSGAPALRTEADGGPEQHRLIVTLCIVASFLLIALVSLIGAMAGMLPAETAFAVLTVFSTAMAGITWWYFRYKEPRA